MENEKPTAEAAPDQAAPMADEVAVSGAAEQLAALAAERDNLAQANAELQDRLLRRAAEFENFRRRTERETAERFEFAAQDAVKAMLPALDDFERALKSETAGKEYARGMELIYQRMFEALKKLGLEPIEAAGKPFDPYIHHAIDRAPSSEVPEDTVLEDLQRGYNFKGRLLRPSMVRVARKPEEA
jgi:molecular chaperone GrpE